MVYRLEYFSILTRCKQHCYSTWVTFLSKNNVKRLYRTPAHANIWYIEITLFDFIHEGEHMSLATEQRISLKEAAKILDVSVVTVRSYCNHGLNGICLEHIPRPKKFETSREAIERFLDRISVTPDSKKKNGVIPPVMTHDQDREALRQETGSHRSR